MVFMRGGARWGSMRRRFSVARGAVAALFAFCLFVLIAHDVQASVLRTFDFTQSEWQYSNIPLTGSFSGVVEPSGYIELGDLTSFSLSLDDPPAIMTASLGDLSLFSYKPGSASSLDIELSNTDGQFCMGASVQLDPVCNPGGFPSSARGTKGPGVGSGFADFTLDAPVITDVTPAPLSTRFSWSQILMGVSIFGLFRLVGAIRPASVAAWLCRFRLAVGSWSV